MHLKQAEQSTAASRDGRTTDELSADNIFFLGKVAAAELTKMHKTRNFATAW